MEILSKIYTLLGLDESTPAKAQIEAIYEVVTGRLLGKLSAMTGEEVKEIPEALKGIVVEVCVNRYNRIGSEGAQSHGVDGESLSWSNDDYFAPYEKDISTWVSSRCHPVGKVRFL